MINQRRRKRYCGYCKQIIDSIYEEFDRHLEYCEMALSNKIETEREDEDNDKPERITG